MIAFRKVCSSVLPVSSGRLSMVIVGSMGFVLVTMPKVKIQILSFPSLKRDGFCRNERMWR